MCIAAVVLLIVPDGRSVSLTVPGKPFKEESHVCIGRNVYHDYHECNHTRVSAVTEHSFHVHVPIYVHVRVCGLSRARPPLSSTSTLQALT